MTFLVNFDANNTMCCLIIIILQQDLGRANVMTSAPGPDDDQYSVATSEENKEKNRYSNKLPSKLHQTLFITHLSMLSK